MKRIGLKPPDSYGVRVLIHHLNAVGRKPTPATRKRSVHVCNRTMSYDSDPIWSQTLHAVSGGFGNIRFIAVPGKGWP